MIRYALRCAHGDEFEAWFASSGDYDRQEAARLIDCPFCGSTEVEKAPMAPNVIRTDRAAEASPRAMAMAMAQKVRETIRDSFDYVGERFPDEARRIHAGNADERPIWGEATPEQAKEMAEEGLPVSALPPELTPTPPTKLN